MIRKKFFCMNPKCSIFSIEIETSNPSRNLKICYSCKQELKAESEFIKPNNNNIQELFT